MIIVSFFLFRDQSRRTDVHMLIYFKPDILSAECHGNEPDPTTCVVWHSNEPDTKTSTLTPIAVSQAQQQAQCAMIIGQTQLQVQYAKKKASRGNMRCFTTATGQK